ncbi:MAG: hypothetical protein GYB20_12655 [Oceanospirillales bacterium]|nr:hypothetical protein [Oceanospirillales bacterium]MBR9888527.1 hypothetical protein [Oceanospirillales bacterium]
MTTFNKSDGDSDRLYAEQVRLLHNPFRTSVMATVAASVLLVAIQWNVIDHDILIEWFLLMLCLTLIRFILAEYYNHQPEEELDARLWGRIFNFGVAVSGAVWGWSSVLLFPAENLSHQIIVAFVIVGMCCGAVTTLSVMRSAVFTFIGLALTPIFMIFLLEDSREAFIISLMLLLSLIFFIKGSNNIYLNTVQNICLRLESNERERSLAIAIDRADHSNQAKSEFLSSMSHELRTPMNAILGFGQLLEIDKDRLEPEQQMYVDEILTAGGHLLSLINDVLDLSKIESGNLSVSIEKVIVDDVLKESLSLVRAIAQDRNIAIIDQLSGSGYSVNADFSRLKQVVINLLSNAVKYNRADGSITISGEIIANKHLRISVTDTGQGLTEQEISKLFKPFVRLQKEDNVEGTGIGLVISKNLTHLMGGSLGVKSTPNVGSTFWIELSLSKQPPASIQ